MGIMNFYDKTASGYNELYGEEQARKLRIIKDILKVNKTDLLLDIGCGTGISSDFHCRVIGLDRSLQLIKQSNIMNKAIGMAEELPFKDSSFDHVVTVTAIHNFKDAKKSISEMKRVGKCNFILSILKKSKKFNSTVNLIKSNFKVEKEVDEGKDAIFFCKPRPKT